MEEFYLKYGRDWFPKHYPTSALLGCVDIDDILSAEDYKKQIKVEEQESESEYVFIGKNPRQLIVPFSISGKPYICKN
jgi:activating signal cointegrator 1